MSWFVRIVSVGGEVLLIYMEWNGFVSIHMEVGEAFCLCLLQNTLTLRRTLNNAHHDVNWKSIFRGNFSLLAF